MKIDIKKVVLALMALALLIALGACSPEAKDNEESDGGQSTPEELTVTGEVLDITDHTATLTGYAHLPFELGNAEVGILYDSHQSFEAAEKLVAGELDGNNMYTVTATELLPSTTYYYKSYVQNGRAVKVGAVKSFKTSFYPVESVFLDEKEYAFHNIGNTQKFTATVLPADATDKRVEWFSSNTHVAKVDADGVVTAIGNGTTTITAKTLDKGKTATCVVTVAQWVTSITLDKTSLLLVMGEEGMLSVTSIHPENAKDKSYIWSSSDEAIASVDNSGRVLAKTKGATTLVATAIDGSGVTATCDVLVSNPCPDGAVDMGIYSSEGYRVYWATSNLCSSGLCANPQDYGDHYAWGELDPKSEYNWCNYKFGTSDSGPFTKYCTNSTYGTVDNKTVLEPEDDVAHVKLGGGWRIATKEEWAALRTQCTWEWTENYNGTGVAGRIVTASNDNSIFFPAAGFWYFMNTDGYNCVGTQCDYRSSTIYEGVPCVAFCVQFTSDNLYCPPEFRCCGLSVRPVSE